MSIISGNKFGQAVKKARKQSNLTQESIEGGRRHPSFTLLEKIVKELNISLDALFLGKENSNDAVLSELEIMLRKCDCEQLTMIRYMINGLLQGS